MSEKILLEQEFELVKGIFRSFNKGILYLKKDELKFVGRDNLSILLIAITSANIGSWNGNTVLEIKTRHESFKFYPYKQVSIMAALISPEYGALQNKSGSVVELWINMINKVREEKNIESIANKKELPIDILKLRLAKGEISIEEFNKLKEFI